MYLLKHPRSALLNEMLKCLPISCIWSLISLIGKWTHSVFKCLFKATGFLKTEEQLKHVVCFLLFANISSFFFFFSSILSCAFKCFAKRDANGKVLLHFWHWCTFLGGNTLSWTFKCFLKSLERRKLYLQLEHWCTFWWSS